MEKFINNLAIEKKIHGTDPQHQQARIEGKIVRLNLTDRIKDLIPYAEKQGSESPEMLYMVYSKLVNDILFDFDPNIPKKANKRELMDMDSLKTAEYVEMEMEKIIKRCMAAGLHYKKEIYPIVKKKVQEFEKFTGKRYVPAFMLPSPQKQLDTPGQRV